MDLTNPIVLSLLISFAIQAFFFAFAATLKTDKVTDLSYGLTFIVLAIFWLIRNDVAIDSLKILVAVLVILWGVRIAGYLLFRIIKTGTDDRFDDRRDDVIAFAKFWILQGTAVWAIMIPAVYMLSRTEELAITGYAIVGSIVMLVGLVIETVADQQMYRFKFHKDSKGKWIDKGLWHYSRHPNYFGEMIVWWGIFIIGFPIYEGLGWLTIIGPIFITVLLRYVSGVPLLEKKAEKRWGDNPNYIKYRESTNLLIIGPKQSRTSENS
jgi:steroid 5-alpha reductase family enzyme